MDVDMETRVTISTLPPELLINCCRFGTAAGWAAMSAVCRTWRDLLKMLPSDSEVWKGWALQRFRRLALIIRSEAGIDWAKLYREQLAADRVVPEAHPMPPRSKLEDFTLSVEIVRGPLANEYAGKVEFEWASAVSSLVKTNATNGRQELCINMWSAGEAPTGDWFSICMHHEEDDTSVYDCDFRFNLYVSKVTAGSIKTVKLVDGALLEGVMGYEVVFQVEFLPDVLGSKIMHPSNAGVHGAVHSKMRDIGFDDLIVYHCRPWIDLMSGSVTDLIYPTEDGSAYRGEMPNGELSADEILFYLDHSVPW